MGMAKLIKRFERDIGPRYARAGRCKRSICSRLCSLSPA
jgi:hypothetical protein